MSVPTSEGWKSLVMMWARSRYQPKGSLQGFLEEIGMSNSAETISSYQFEQTGGATQRILIKDVEKTLVVKIIYSVETAPLD
jgi:ABC-type microcin C transport system duplicated ATPase subunit YejF